MRPLLLAMLAIGALVAPLAAAFEKPEDLRPAVLKVAPPGRLTFAVGLTCGSEPVGVVLIAEGGAIRYVTTANATKADVAAVRALFGAKQAVVIDACEGRREQ
ncbi:MAG TPA: hypothetical protein VF161_00885 [Steroidobacteraceae bacterium]